MKAHNPFFSDIDTMSDVAHLLACLCNTCTRFVSQSSTNALSFGLSPIEPVFGELAWLCSTPTDNDSPRRTVSYAASRT